MNVVDYISLAVIAFSTIICTIKGLRRMIFKVCSILIAVVISRFFGDWILDKIDIRIDHTLGLIAVFFAVYIIFRLIFKLIEVRLDSNVGSVFIDRLLGAIIGLLIGLALIYMLYEVVDEVYSIVSYFGKEEEFYELVDGAVIFSSMNDLNGYIPLFN